MISNSEPFNNYCPVSLHEILPLFLLIMVLRHHAKWIYAAAGSGVAVGFFNYLQSNKSHVETSWTVNHVPSVKWDYNWDRRDLSSMIRPAKDENDPSEQNRINETKEKLKPTAYRHIILIRHGQYEEEAKKAQDRKLTALGRRQADFVGKRLKELGHNYTTLTRSTMVRAIETSDIILKYFPNLTVLTDQALEEGSPIPPEPPTGVFRPEYKFFRDGARIEGAFRKYFYRAKASQKCNSYDIIVCHANVMRYFICRALQFPPEGWLRISLDHCSITWITITPRGHVIVSAVGDSGYIPPEALSH